VSPEPEADLDRLATALVNLLAAWWRQHEREAGIAEPVATSHKTLARAGYARRREAPAVTGADETRPEHHTRRDMTS
jgi:hypothetical protein